MNGSGCIVDGEHAPMTQQAPSSLNEKRIRKTVFTIALIATALGVLWCGAGMVELFSRSYAMATVDGVIPQEGECRRPSGRYEHCIQSRLVISYKTKNSDAVLHGEILLSAKGVTIKPGETLSVAYREDAPQDVVIPDLMRLAKAPLGLLLSGLMVLLLERLTR